MPKTAEKSKSESYVLAEGQSYRRAARRLGVTHAHLYNVLHGQRNSDILIRRALRARLIVPA